jgi:hypothetical protein
MSNIQVVFNLIRRGSFAEDQDVDGISQILQRIIQHNTYLSSVLSICQIHMFTILPKGIPDEGV